MNRRKAIREGLPVPTDHPVKECPLCTHHVFREREVTLKGLSTGAGLEIFPSKVIKVGLCYTHHGKEDKVLQRLFERKGVK